MCIRDRKIDSLGLSNIRPVQGVMGALSYPSDSFDAVICTWAMGHGFIADAERAIAEIYRVVRAGGTVITDFMSTLDSTFGIGVQLEPNTFLGSMKGEEHIPHHYFTQSELRTLFANFTHIDIAPVRYEYGPDHARHSIEAFDVMANK